MNRFTTKLPSIGVKWQRSTFALFVNSKWLLCIVKWHPARKKNCIKTQNSLTFPKTHTNKLQLQKANDYIIRDQSIYKTFPFRFPPFRFLWAYFHLWTSELMYARTKSGWCFFLFSSVFLMTNQIFFCCSTFCRDTYMFGMVYTDRSFVFLFFFSKRKWRMCIRCYFHVDWLLISRIDVYGITKMCSR